MIIRFRSHGPAAVEAVATTAMAFKAVGFEPALASEGGISARTLQLLGLATHFDVPLTGWATRTPESSFTSPILVAAVPDGRRAIEKGTLDLRIEVDGARAPCGHGGWRWRPTAGGDALPLGSPSLAGTQPGDKAAQRGRGAAFAAQLVAAHILGVTNFSPATMALLLREERETVAGRLLVALAREADNPSSAIEDDVSRSLPTRLTPQFAQAARRHALGGRRALDIVRSGRPDIRPVRFA